MNRSEKKALISFLLIYVGSTLLLLSVLFSSYYKKEKEMLTSHCSIEMTSAANELKAEILNFHMDDKKFEPQPLENRRLNFGIFDKNGKTIFSNMVNNIPNLDKIPLYNSTHAFYSTTIDLHDEEFDVKYIIIETDQIINEVNKLKLYMVGLLILSAIFIAIIGFLLAKILLKPLREKVNHLDNFIKDSAHELNTPIAVLMTSVSTLKQGRNVEKMLKYIVSSSKQISQLYNDIHYSAFNEKEDVLNEKFNLADLIYESVDFFEDIAVTKNIKINVNLEKCEVFMDRTKASKVINNLLSNAIKYSKKDSNIELRLKDFILEVEDFGIGISKEEQKEIFKRYKRGKNLEGGFGIGLDIVSEICKFYDLKLSLKSTPKIGSTFSVDFSSVLFK